MRGDFCPVGVYRDRHSGEKMVLCETCMNDRDTWLDDNSDFVRVEDRPKDQCTDCGETADTYYQDSRYDAYESGRVYEGSDESIDFKVA